MSLRINIFVALIPTTYTLFEPDKAMMNALMCFRKKTVTDKKTARHQAQATSLERMLYADDASVVSESPEQLRKLLIVFKVMCDAFGIIV